MTVPNDTTILGVPVEIENIEAELRQLWEVDEARTNASLINLVVYSEEPGSLAKNSDVVREITREHACRAILVGLDKDEPDSMTKAWITAHCHLAHGRKSVCCEQIAFHLTGHSRGRFRNTVFAHMQSDLPLVFWWQGDLSDMFSESLYRRIDRLIYDSSSWKHPAESMKNIAGVLKDDRIVAQDLAWTRSYHYRLAVAALYDDPAVLHSLPATQKIKITGHVDHRFTVLLLVAWITDLAGWEKSQDLITDDSSAEGTSFRFAKSNGDLVDIEISYLSDCAPVAKLEIHAPETIITINREPSGKLLRHLICVGEHVVESHGPADSDQSDELVADQLSRGGKNSLYRRILPKFLELQ